MNWVQLKGNWDAFYLLDIIEQKKKQVVCDRICIIEISCFLLTDIPEISM